jgi:predicted transposase/invertase (TIGR01784 family)
MVFLEIPKFLQKEDKKDDILTQWLMLIAGKEDELKMSKNVSNSIKEIMERIDEMNMDSAEWELYQSRLKALYNYNSGMYSAEKRGLEAGRKEGEANGIVKGKTEEKLEIAKKMLEKNFPIEEITALTGLSKEEIEKL